MVRDPHLSKSAANVNNCLNKQLVHPEKKMVMVTPHFGHNSVSGGGNGVGFGTLGFHGSY
jgi:hypothetical protein